MWGAVQEQGDRQCKEEQAWLTSVQVCLGSRQVSIEFDCVLP
jgi:hypothetical protein